MTADDRALDRDALAAVLLGVCDTMVASLDALADADRAIGDGDHGLAIGRGFRAARDAIVQPATGGVGELFEAIGLAMLTTMGGAAGPIYGTLFRAGGRGLRGFATFDAAALATFLEGGLAGVRERGGATLGDKTIVDALGPSAVAARAAAGSPLPEALAAVAKAAAEGMDRTRDLRATIGKARALGDRSIGHVDPGAMSFTLMIQALEAQVAGTATRPGSTAAH